MSAPSIIGPLFSAHLMEEAVIAALRKRLPAYLDEACQQHDVNGIEWVKSWSLGSGYVRWPEMDLPALIVACPGIAGDPERHSNGMYRAVWPFEISVTISGSVAHLIRRDAQIYAAAVRGAILQRRSLGLGGAVTWHDEAYADVPNDLQKTIVAAANSFSVEVDEVVSWRDGPKDLDLPDSIPAEYPEITEVDADVEAK